MFRVQYVKNGRLVKRDFRDLASAHGYEWLCKGNLTIAEQRTLKVVAL